jgi:hypothetical protein
MSVSLKKLWNDYGIGAILVLLIVAYGVNMIAGYLGAKGSTGYESAAQMSSQYKNPNQPPMQNPNTNTQASGAVLPAQEYNNEVFASVNGIQTSMPGIPSSCSQPNIQNPAELLPKGSDNQWAQLNPSGKGELANVNLLKAGYHIGIDTIGQSLRNANLQIRSEPPNPQLNVGPWMNSTIEPDFMRVPLELGSGQQ